MTRARRTTLTALEVELLQTTLDGGRLIDVARARHYSDSVAGTYLERLRSRFAVATTAALAVRLRDLGYIDANGRVHANPC